MVVDFVSADYGWLTSLDRWEQTCILFKAGKACDGYFTNNNIIKHTTAVIDILDKDYSSKDHVLGFDNATTHLKCEDNALSAQKMPKFTPKVGQNWGVKVNKIDENGNLIHDTDGKVLKI